MNDYLDDLSEDWPSHPPSLNASTTSRRLGSSTGSRIPRRSISGVGIGGKTTHTSRNASGRRSALAERSFSEDNIMPSGTCERHSEKSTKKTALRRSLSAESAQSGAMYNTVEVKSRTPSPRKSRGDNGTPEWRRRLLKGEMGYGERTDLFAPTGIESIFQPPQPPPHNEVQPKGRGLSFLNHLEAIPSSPPWPPSSMSVLSPGMHAGVHSGNLHAVDESDEISKQSSLASLSPSSGQGSVIVMSTTKVNNTSQFAAAELVENEEDDEADDVFSDIGSIPASVRNGKGTRNRNSAAFAEALASKSRASSGQSLSDSFSAVYISKHNTADGRIEYAPLDLSKSELKDRLAKLGMSKSNKKGEQHPLDQSKSDLEEPSFSGFQSDDLPEGLPAGTPELVNIGDFITVKRGGYSDDGSFRRRPLSPSPLARPPSNRARGSSQFSAEDSVSPEPIQQSTFSNPQTPTRTQRGLKPAHEDNRKPTSPLKIFGDHDTFTANKLQRRISQLENTLHDTKISSQDNSNPSQATTAIRRSPVEHAVPIEKQQQNMSGRSHTDAGRQISMTSQFGEGELDGYTFPDELSLCSVENSEVEYTVSNDLPSRSPSPDTMPPGSQQPFRFRVESASDANDTFKHKRKQSKVSAKSTLSVTKRNSVRRDMARPMREDEKGSGHIPSESQYQEGKRPPNSPFKEPTPKRRRTLMTADQPAPQSDDGLLSSVRESHERIQTAIGKKRKNARYDGAMNVAGPEVLARRHILRPRNPTPSQRRDESIHDEIFEAAEAFMSSSPRLASIREHLNVPVSPNAPLDVAQARAVASEVAAFSERINMSMVDDSRKRSVTTQDFLDEAMKIMHFIRNKGRPSSGLDNLQESHLEDANQEDEKPAEPHSASALSRPPSREGESSGWRPRQPKALDPKVLNHLQKFQETDDDHFIASSVGSRFGREAEHAASRIEVIESHPPGLHLMSRHPKVDSQGRPRSDSNATVEEPKSTGTNISGRSHHSSHTSVDSSLGRTTASRKSEIVATLAPEAVAHLIPEEVAGMSFDRDKGIWVKNRSPTKEPTVLEDLSAVTPSEDDPFGEIPDLTFDEEEEAKRLAKRKDLTVDERSALREEYLRRHRERDPTPLPVVQDEAITKDDAQTTEASTAPWGAQDSSRPSTADSTRGTSWTEQRTAHMIEHSSYQRERTGTTTSHESVEHEIKINEGRDHQRIPPVARKITVSLVSNSRTDIRDFENEQNNPCIPVLNQQQTPARAANSTLHPHDYGATTVPRSSPLPPLSEHHEISFIGTAPGKRHVNFSVSIAQDESPSKRGTALVEAASSPSKGDLTYYLSELSDFTINQIDEREVQTRAVIRRPMRQEIEDRFASGNQVLVKALQDNEADEPFWEDLRAIDLRQKGLTSLHLLDFLCDRLEKADLSCNALNQLSGAPPTLRSLNVHENRLSSLTWWGHLTNLQYLDVSGNDIT